MKNYFKNLLSTTFLAFTSIAFSQDNVKEFEINSKNGLVDENGTELVEPKYKNVKKLQYGKLFLLSDGSDADVYFNANTKKKLLLDHLSWDVITMNGKPHLKYSDKADKKTFLIDINDDQIIPLKQYYHSIKSVGDYLLTMVEPKKLPAKPEPKIIDKKTGLPLIQKVPEDRYSEDFIVYKNDGKFVPIFKAYAKNFYPLYEDKRKVTKENNMVIEEVKIIDVSEQNSENFDYLALSDYRKNNDILIYDSKFKKVGAINYDGLDEYKISNLASEVLKKELSVSPFSRSGISPVSGPGGPMRVDYPHLIIEKNADGKNILYQVKSETEKLALFSTSNNIDVYGSSKINIETKDKKDDAGFSVGVDSGKIYFPKKYWEKFNMN
ncbi:hypothetical protein SAMN05660477_02882 [Soonwooa buanensis]|uniref:WG containing repeat-containing protein n=1 Tax=Soonwooa buanensis TaxID=619805 RepID=A0A1T5GIR6_9FLAO|nr:hypothetical protein [Soonwooa buanensis]SKC08220.1 hypothetical protein SAMN05660477_02882 [Soonwooa buanensis]